MNGKVPAERRHVAFRITREQRERAAGVIAAIRADSTPRAHAEALIAVVVELTEAGMHAYYLTPLERVGIGPLMMNAARVGVGAAERTLPPLVRRIVGAMSDQQLKKMAEIIDEMIV